LTGKPFSTQRALWPSKGERNSARSCFFGLDRAPADLHARIDARVDQMFARGLIDETKALLARGLEQNRTAMQAIGYRQVVEHLRGQRSLAETVELVKIRTRQFAKRQKTWFRRQGDIEWISLSDQDDARAVVQQLLRRIPG